MLLSPQWFERSLACNNMAKIFSENMCSKLSFGYWILMAAIIGLKIFEKVQF